jgi:hypothetical protein
MGMNCVFSLESTVSPETLHEVLRRELFMNSDFADSFVEFASNVKDPELSKYLQGAVAPSDSLACER